MEHSWGSVTALISYEGSVRGTGYLSVCGKCGLTANKDHPKIYYGPCPPWREKKKGEDTTSERAHEAELIQELKEIADVIETATRFLNPDTLEFRMRHVAKQSHLLRQLIQKYEELKLKELINVYGMNKQFE